MNINQLKEGAKKFINNNGVNPTLSDNPEKAIKASTCGAPAPQSSQ